jgi:hypothetical protein
MVVFHPSIYAIFRVFPHIVPKEVEAVLPSKVSVLSIARLYHSVPLMINLLVRMKIRTRKSSKSPDGKEGVEWIRTRFASWRVVDV